MKLVYKLLAIVCIQILLVSCTSIGQKGGNIMSDQIDIIGGQDIVTAMLNNQYKQLYSQFSNELKAIASLKDFEALGKDFTANENSFNLISSSLINNYEHFIWHNEAKDKGITAALDKDDVIVGFQVLFLTSYPETDELYSEVHYQLPFNDEWYVFWGGKDVLTNYHYEYEQNRYAYDFVKTVNGFSYEGDPLLNESYFAFDQDVLAPANGIVVEVKDGIEDSTPGVMNTDNPEGNMVIIEHEHGEYSLLAHFKKNSIVVNVGDTVEAGQLLGKTGNSGHSSEAHIHFQVFKRMANGNELVVPISFTNGKEWVKGELASN